MDTELAFHERELCYRLAIGGACHTTFPPAVAIYPHRLVEHQHLAMSLFDIVYVGPIFNMCCLIAQLYSQLMAIRTGDAGIALDSMGQK